MKAIMDGKKGYDLREDAVEMDPGNYADVRWLACQRHGSSP
jgi:hypothetical protein